MAVSFGKKGGQKPKAPVKQESAGTSSAHVFRKLQKEFGKEFVTTGGAIAEVERIPTNIFPLDLAIGGGLPKSRVSILYGPEGSAKSLTLYKALAGIQKQGMQAVLVELEHVWDKSWGARIPGLNVDDLIVVRPDNAEQAVDAVEAFLYASDVGMVGLDSIATMAPNNEIESSASKVIVASNAPIVTKMTRKITTALSRETKNDHFPAFVCINQIRHKVNVMFGDPETMPGGFALGFAASMKIRFYGKNLVMKDVSQKQATYKHVTGAIKKARVPIVGSAFEYDIATLEHNRYHGNVVVPMAVGDVDAVDTVMEFASSLGLLKAANKTYTLLGQQFKTLKAVEHQYRSDEGFADKLNQTIWSKAKLDYGSVPEHEIPEEIMAEIEKGEE